MSECYVISIFFIQLFLLCWSLIVGGMGWYVVFRDVQHGSRHYHCLEKYPFYRLIFAGDQSLTKAYLGAGIISSMGCFGFAIGFVVTKLIFPILPCIVFV